MRFILLSILVATTSFLGANAICFFRPPDQWMPADPSALSPLVKVGFYGPPSQLGFCPSINLAEEKVRCSLKEYLDAVKKIHSSNRHKVWSYLGTISTRAGEAALTQIDLPSQSGPLRLLQLIFLQGDTAYILTASCLKKDFIQVLPIFRQAFNSLQLKEDLYCAIEDEKRRENALRLYAAAKEAVLEQGVFSPEANAWKSFQEEMIRQFPDLGPYWQALVIAGAYKRLQSLFKTEAPTSVSAPLHLLEQIESYMADIELMTHPYSHHVGDLHFIKKRL